MSDVLEKILDAKKERLAHVKKQHPLAALQGLASQESPVLDFWGAVTKKGSIHLIAEMKRQSPSAGPIRPDFDPGSIGAAYAQGGASALSVLTEEVFFKGSLNDLKAAKKAAQLPVLRKDFIFDAYQLTEARAYGADAILLIADMLDAAQLKELVQAAKELKLEPLVEVFEEKNVPATLSSGARLIGINTRNLRTLEILPDNVTRLSQLIPSDRAIVAESGIKTASDIQKLGDRISAVLVGESLLKQRDLRKAVESLLGNGGNTQL
jgi:indole-3-glycerol phosphate synthase